MDIGAQICCTCWWQLDGYWIISRRCVSTILSWHYPDEEWALQGFTIKWSLFQCEPDFLRDGRFDEIFSEINCAKGRDRLHRVILSAACIVTKANPADILSLTEDLRGQIVGVARHNWRPFSGDLRARRDRIRRTVTSSAASIRLRSLGTQIVLTEIHYAWTMIQSLLCHVFASELSNETASKFQLWLEECVRDWLCSQKIQILVMSKIDEISRAIQKMG